MKQACSADPKEDGYFSCEFKHAVKKQDILR